MKLALQALQAVTVEFLGVLLVVWMLFGFASWGLSSATGRKPQWNQTVANVLVTWKNCLAEAMPQASADNPERSAYVAQRLDHYGQLFGTASRNFFDETFNVQ